MQIDAARYEPLSQGEKDRRHREGLCYFMVVQNTGYQSSRLSQRV
jgi:hypothetical protein